MAVRVLLMHGVAILVLLSYFIIVVIFLTIIWRIALALDIASRCLSDIARDIKKIADKGDK